MTDHTNDSIWENFRKRMHARGYVPSTPARIHIVDFLNLPNGLHQWKFQSPSQPMPVFAWQIPGKLKVDMVRHLCKFFSDHHHIIIQSEDGQSHTAVSAMGQMAPECFELMEESSLLFDLLEACSTSQFDIIHPPYPPKIKKELKFFPRLLKTDAMVSYFKLAVDTVIFVPSEFRYYVVK